MLPWDSPTYNLVKPHINIMRDNERNSQARDLVAATNAT